MASSDKYDIREEYPGKDLESMSLAVNYNNWLIEMMSPYLGENTAEVGAGNGNITRLLIEQNINQLTAFEPSGNMYGVLKKIFNETPGIKLINDKFLNLTNQYNNYFDTVLYINVLEHIENDMHELNCIKETLKPGGYLCIFVPALSWLYSEFDKSIGHFRRYEKKQLSRLLISTGYVIEKSVYVDFFGIIPWYVVFVLMKRKLTPGAVDIYDRFAVPLARRFEKLFPVPRGKNIFVVARIT